MKNIMFEKARGPDGKLTDWKTGRRFVWIDLPSSDVKRSMNMGSFTAYIFFREMRDKMQCRRCLQSGHKAIDCRNEEVCLTCKKTGHRRGDPTCTLEQKEDEGEYQDNEENKTSSDEEDEMSDQTEDEVSDEEEQKEEEIPQQQSGEYREKETEEVQTRTTDLQSESAEQNCESTVTVKGGKKSSEDERKRDTQNKQVNIDNNSKKKSKQCKGQKLSGKESKKKNNSSLKIKTPKDKTQSSIDSYVSTDGKRLVKEILSPNDDKSGSPDQRRLKLDE